MSRRFDLIITCAVSLMLSSIPSTLQADITANSQNDPYPVFTSLDPHTFLYTYERQMLKGITPIRSKPEQFTLSISPFGQGANKARIKKHDPTVTIAADTEPCNLPDPCKDICIEIGDLGGKWAMVGLLFGALPQGAVLPPALVEARSILYPDVPLGTPINDPFGISPTQTYGFFSIPVCYRKNGVRFEFETLLSCNVGIKAQAGVAEICQTPSEFINQTPATCTLIPTDPSGSCNPVNTNFTPTNINDALMTPCKLKQIAEQIGLDISSFQQLSAEDVRLGVYWRHAYLINENSKTWPEFLLIPYAHVAGSLVAGHHRDPSKAFGLSFGSNHNAIGFTAGLNLDFTETIEIGAEAGLTHFFSRDICNMRIPNSLCQSGIYPFTADANVQPGNNAEFAAKMNAYHFLGRLSFYLQYVFIKHEKDTITLNKPDPAFFPEKLARKSCWKNQLFNAAFTYDIAPNIALGVLWQAPFKQDHTYRSTTLLFTFNVTF